MIYREPLRTDFSDCHQHCKEDSDSDEDKVMFIKLPASPAHLEKVRHTIRFGCCATIDMACAGRWGRDAD